MVAVQNWTMIKGWNGISDLCCAILAVVFNNGVFHRLVNHVGENIAERLHLRED